MRGLSAALAAILVAGLACSSGGGARDAGGGSGGGGGATGGGGGATNATCQDMRMCVMDCGDDACVNTCKSRGDAAAQAAFQALYDCTKDSARGACPMANAIDDCVCMAQCFDGACLAETDACVNGAAVDLVCEMRCH